MSELRAPDLVLSRRLARLMDDAVTLPGTGIGVGLDALVGLVPGVGDLVGSALSGMIMIDGVRCRVPLLVLVRMALNLVLDSVLGLVPFVGDLLDVAHRANRKNLRLLERALNEGQPRRAPTTGYVVTAVALVVLALLVALALAVVALWLLVAAVRG